MAERNRKLTEILLFIFAIFVVVVAGINTHYYHSIYNATVEETTNVNPTVVSQTAAYNWMVINIILLIIGVIYLFYRTWVFFFTYEFRQELKADLREWNSETRPWKGIIGTRREYGDETEYVSFLGKKGVLTSKSYLTKPGTPDTPDTPATSIPAKLKYKHDSDKSTQSATQVIGGSNPGGLVVFHGPGGTLPS